MAFYKEIIKILLEKINLKDIKTMIDGILGRETTPVQVEEDRDLTIEEMLDLLDYSKFTKPLFVSGYDPNRKTIILLDDLVPTKFLYEIAMEDIDKSTNTVFLEKFNVIYFFGKNIGFSFIDFLRTTDIKIDYAILDITINTYTRVKNTTLDLDGVDLAIEINKKYPNCTILFNSAHTMNPRNPTVSNFMGKFKKHFGIGLESQSIDKMSNISLALKKLLRKEYE